MAKRIQTTFKQAKTTVDTLGNKQLRVGKKYKVSGWLVFDAIAILIIISVATLRLTSAGGNYSFMIAPAQMQGGELKRSVASGEYRQLISNGVHAETGAQITAEQMAASTKLCADMNVRSDNTFIDIQINGKFANKFSATPGSSSVCVDVVGQGAGTVYAGTSGNADVTKIYGLSE